MTPTICGIGIIIFATSRLIWFSLIMFAVIGLGSILQISSSNTFIQTIVEDDKRGRVMSLFTMSFLGMAPFGNLSAGALAEKTSALNTLMVSGTFCIIGSFLFASQLPKIRHSTLLIYQKTGMLPETKV